MQEDITYYAKRRYTTKSYDPQQKISEQNFEKIRELLRFSASSTNLQPWHFILAATEEGKRRVAKAAEGLFSFNKQALLDASHIVVFCVKTDMDADYINKVVEQEEKDQRFAANPAEFKAASKGGKTIFSDIHKYDLKDLQHWMEKQVYLNVGQFLLGVSTLGIDATPMEGIDTKVLDEEFGLRKLGYTSLVAVPLGYHNKEADYNLSLPKSRLPYSEILTEI